ncbi:hypothetical protein [Polyangium spumosum]|uniref:Thioredoxin domain-containing protein n=1 Tax=Polyangium spumosum TaxID=889282 RepID=A0A6N7PJV5_9BACT|nr:hypothetical protein [Polyangium spumosum]MRG92219.1 hypothetical protein [Polyangium spumosum]
MTAWFRRAGGSLLLLACVLLAPSAGGQARPPAETTCPPNEGAACAPPSSAPPAPAASAEPQRPAAPRLLFFWGVGCPHCEDAKPFVAELEAREPGIVVERIEVRRSDEGRRRFVETVERLGVEGAGIPMFVVDDRAFVGFHRGVTEGDVLAALDRAPGGHAPGTVTLPLVGSLDPRAVPLPVLTLLIGLVDGINPCAMYVLIVLLGILTQTRSRARILLFGATFVLMSGLVYFLFMTAWLNAFLFAGVSRWVTLALGVLLVGMGLVNLKELVWFHKGVSLMIPAKAKPGLFRRMRAVAAAASLPAAFLGILALSFLVNLVELGCTLGLPAVYTRILSLHDGLGAAARYGYLALYNVAYIVPLALIVILYAKTMRRFFMSEQRAKVLKAVSGALLLLFGILFLVAPDMLSR